MAAKTNYARAILQELKGVPPEKLPLLLQLIRLLKEERLLARQATANALQDIDDMAIETGIPDLADRHDYYLYGVDRYG